MLGTIVSVFIVLLLVLLAGSIFVGFKTVTHPEFGQFCAVIILFICFVSFCG